MKHTISITKIAGLALVSSVSLLLIGCSSGWPSASAPTPAPQVAKVATSNYMPYSESAVKLAMAEGKKTAVFFHGASCGSCAKLDANIKANQASIPADVAIFNADWDKNQDLAKEFNVAKYHTVSYLNDSGVAKNVWGLFELNNLVAEFDTPAPQASNYMPYSESAVKLAMAEGKKTAVFFHGASCGSCAKLDANIKANQASIPADVAIFNADWDSNQDLAKEFNVAKYHTVSFVWDDGVKNVPGLFELDKLLLNF